MKIPYSINIINIHYKEYIFILEKGNYHENIIEELQITRLSVPLIYFVFILHTKHRCIATFFAVHIETCKAIKTSTANECRPFKVLKGLGCLNF